MKIREILSENFADKKIKGKSRPGRVKRAGASCKGSVASLRARAKKYGGERGKMYHWCANMKAGREKTSESLPVNEIFDSPYKLPKKWQGGHASEHFAKEIKLPDNRIFKIDFDWDPENRYALVNFYVDDQQGITGQGDSVKIFSTFVSAMKQFVSSKHPTIIAFMANATDSSRVKLYDKLVPWMIQNKITSGYSNFTNDIAMLPDDFIEWVDDRQDTSGKMYVLVDNVWFDDYIDSHEDLHETLLLEADDTVFVNEKPINILINPGYQRMIGMAQKLSDRDLRLLYIPSQDAVIVWPAASSVHYDMAVALRDQLGWDLGENLRQNMIHRTDPKSPISAKFLLTPPMVDSQGRPRRDTNIHRRVSDFAVVALPAFYNLDWWERIKRTAPQITETWTKKYKRSINCSHPKGFSQKAHCAARRKRRAGGKTKSKPVREDISPSQKILATNLIKLMDHVDLVQMPTVNGGKTFIVELDQRPIVVVRYGGHTVPFYCSTGQGDKASVASGKWYPFWGIGDDGWFNKGTENMINKFYSSKTLANTAAKLNQYLGNLVGTKGIPMAGNSAIAVINNNQQPQSKMFAADDLIKYYARIADQIRSIG